MEAGIEKDKAEEMAKEIAEITEMPPQQPCVITCPAQPVYQTYPPNPWEPNIMYYSDGTSATGQKTNFTFKA